MARDTRDEFRWKDFLLETLTWWRGNTWGTRLWIATQGEDVGTDERGNRYYRSRPGAKPGPNGYERRMVTYIGGYAEASEIPPGWHGWMHHRTDVPPTHEDYVPYEWQKPFVPNQTGTPNAYRPKGSILSGAKPAPRAADYSAWRPE